MASEAKASAPPNPFADKAFDRSLLGAAATTVETSAAAAVSSVQLEDGAGKVEEEKAGGMGAFGGAAESSPARRSPGAAQRRPRGAEVSAEALPAATRRRTRSMTSGGDQKAAAPSADAEKARPRGRLAGSLGKGKGKVVSVKGKGAGGASGDDGVAVGSSDEPERVDASATGAKRPLRSRKTSRPPAATPGSAPDSAKPASAPDSAPETKPVPASSSPSAAKPPPASSSPSSGKVKKPKPLSPPSARTLKRLPMLLRRAKRIGGILDSLYPSPKPFLRYRSPFELLVCVALSAQTTDLSVNAVTPALFAMAPDAHSLAALTPEEVFAVIRTLGLARTKSRNLVGMAKLLVERYDGEVPTTFEALETLPGVGHKTASVVRIQAFNLPAFPVDTHIHRLAERWGLSTGKSVEVTEADLKLCFPDETTWAKRHVQIIAFGREHCPARGHDPHTCPICSWVKKNRDGEDSEDDEDEDDDEGGRDEDKTDSK